MAGASFWWAGASFWWAAVVAGMPKSSLMVGRKACLGSAVLGGLALLPQPAAADGADALPAQQLARARYGPRLLRLREIIDARRARVDVDVAREAGAVRLFVSGTFSRGSERQRQLQALEAELLAAAEANDNGRARQALDSIIEVGEIRYPSPGASPAATAQAPSLPPARAPLLAAPGPSHAPSGLLALLASTILGLTLSRNAMAALTGARGFEPPPLRPQAAKPRKGRPSAEAPASGQHGGEGEAAEGEPGPARAGAELASRSAQGALAPQHPAPAADGARAGRRRSLLSMPRQGAASRARRVSGVTTELAVGVGLVSRAALELLDLDH